MNVNLRKHEQMAVVHQLDHNILQEIPVFIGSALLICALALYLYRSGSGLFNTTMSEGAGNDSTVSDESFATLEKKVLVLGLDGSGKSSLLLALSKNDNEIAPTSTSGFNVISVQTDSTTLNIWEIGGRENFRQYWNNFYADSHMLVFVVDASASHRLGEARSELMKVLQDEHIQQLPVVIVANKQDQSNAKSLDEISEALDLSSLSSFEFHMIATQVPCGQPSSGIEDLEKFMTSVD